MNGQRPRAKHSVRESPPAYTANAARVPPDDAMAATTIYGAAHLAVRHSFSDATPREFDWATAPLPGEAGFADTKRGVRRVRALRDARRMEPNLSDDAWWTYIDAVAPRLSEAERQNTSKILAAVRRRIETEIEVLRRARRADEPEWRGVTERMIREAAALEGRGRWAGPPQPKVAKRLGISVSKMRRAMDYFEMGHWPPGPPRD
jgi:hypothetical protein